MKILLTQNGHEIKDPRWIPEREKYRVGNSRHFVGREALDGASDQVSEWAWSQLKRPLNSLLQGRIKLPEWRAHAVKTMQEKHFGTALIYDGGLDKSADWITLEVKAWLASMFQAEKKYFAELCEGVFVGAFGANFDFNSFEARVKAPLIEGIDELSSLHKNQPQVFRALLAGDGIG